MTRNAFKDVQKRRDRRGIEIDKVGVKDIRYPIKVLDRALGTQNTVANVNMYVTLPHQFKGAHMSRFIEVLNLYRDDINTSRLPQILADIKKRLNAGTAHIEVTFPFFIKKAAPVSGEEGLMEYQCKVHAVAAKKNTVVVEVSAPVTTLCPCSKEISRAGAHNQRCVVTVAVTFKKFVWIEDLISIIENSASCEIYSLLKREDEAHVTERAYRRPMFVEDVVRDVATALMALPDVTWFSVSAEAQESIHNHNAYAYVEKEKVRGARPRM
ncbi:MAG: GTP cyclohydrolase FolE2 [Myxococcota bacterium]|jgi:GTP cyclohydrolase I